MTAKKTKPAADVAAIAQPTAMLIPLEQLRLAPENSRYGLDYDEDGLVALGASMSDPDVRQLTPLNGYPQDGLVMVWDGGRRLAALQRLAGGEGKPIAIPHLAAGIQVQVDADAKAAKLRSMATFVREDMHPAQAFLVYNGLFDEGYSPEQIAAACAVPTPRVKQLLRLRGVAPEIMAAFQAGKLPMDVVEAFTLTTDQDRQREVLASFNKTPSAWDVRNRLRQNAISANDRKAVFVGEEAYLAAGGATLVDLFSNQNDSWADRALVEKLFDEKVEALVQKVAAEGWAWVKYYDGYEYDMGRGLVRVGADLNKKAWAAETELMAQSGAFVRIDYNGEAVVSRGWQTAKAADGTALAKPQTAAQTDPGRFGFGHGGHTTVTNVATQATKVALVRKPQAAYDGLLTHLAWGAFRKARYGSLASDSPSRLVLEQPGQSGVNIEIEGGDEVNAVRARWHARLPQARVAFCDYIAALDAGEKAELLAICFADTVDAVEPGWNARYPARWTHLGWMARHAGVDVATAWTPGEDFLKGGSKDALLDAIRTTPEAAEGNWNQAKKGELVKYVTHLAKDHGWRPQLLREFMDVADPEPSAPKAIMSREAFEALIVEAWRDQGVELDDDAFAAAATRCLDENLEADGLPYGDPSIDWTPEEANSMAEIWDPTEVQADA